MPGPGTNLESAVAGRFDVPNPKEGAECKTTYFASRLYALGAGRFCDPLEAMLYLISEPNLFDKDVIYWE